MLGTPCSLTAQPDPAATRPGAPDCLPTPAEEQISGRAPQRTTSRNKRPSVVFYARHWVLQPSAPLFGAEGEESTESGGDGALYSSVLRSSAGTSTTRVTLSGDTVGDAGAVAGGTPTVPSGGVVRRQTCACCARVPCRDL